MVNGKCKKPFCEFFVRNNKQLRLFLIFNSSLLILISGCRVNYSLSGASIPPSAKTFSVQYFHNQAALTGPTFTQTFTDALRDYMSSQSHLTLVPNGDLDFQGTITGYTTAPISVASSTPNQS